MSGFRGFLIGIWAVISVYTAVVVANHGLNLFPVFFGDMAKMEWAGQFNLDFMCMLMLSGMWVAWRHQLSPGGLGLGLLAFFGGASFLSVYLFVVSLQTRGDVRALLLGEARAAG